jgi:hypothetical protein
VLGVGRDVTLLLSLGPALSVVVVMYVVVVFGLARMWCSYGARSSL